MSVTPFPPPSQPQDVIKEISIMQQCDSDHVVKYYGSYYQNSDLWVSLISSVLCVRLCHSYSVVRLSWNTATAGQWQTLCGSGNKW